MPIDLYYALGSAPCRSVILVAKALGLELNLKSVDLMAGEHLKPEFVKMNPQHTVPTLNDNGFCLWESRAILAYLVEQYGKDDSLYPKDAKKRALVNQRLYFDACTLYQQFGDVVYPMMFAKAPLDKAKKEKLDTSLGFLNTFLEGQTWVAGANKTIADMALASTISTVDAVGFSLSNYPNIEAWFKRVQKELPGYEKNNEGAQQFGNWYKSITKGD